MMGNLITMVLRRHRFLPFKLRRSTKGAVVVEFAVVIIPLILLLILATDAVLAILVSMQVQGAARAGGEFAINVGYDADGIKRAANNSLNTSATAIDAAASAIGIPQTTISVTSTVYCGCPSGTSPYSIIPVAATGAAAAPLCAVYDATTYPGGISTKCSSGSGNMWPVAFAEISVSSSYRPLFGSLFVRFLSSGLLSNTAKVTVVTFKRA